MDQQQSRWRPARRQLLWSVGIVAVLIVAVLIGYRYDIALWDWIKLLIVPAVIAGGGIWFNRQQRIREIELADRRAQDEALQPFLDQMSTLLLEKSLRSSEKDSDVRALARARTLTILSRLDGKRPKSVLQFLNEAGLIRARYPIVDLSGADLNGANLSEAFLPHADLRKTSLYRANLSGAWLDGADLSWANLGGANLKGAHLSNATLDNADLSNASLVGSRAKDAYLRQANLSRAYLSGALWRDADLEQADLSGASLIDVELWGVNLHYAKGVTNDELEKGTNSLEWATMPNGQKYEDWLKSREGDGG